MNDLRLIFAGLFCSGFITGLSGWCIYALFSGNMPEPNHTIRLVEAIGFGMVAALGMWCSALFLGKIKDMAETRGNA